MNGIPNELIDVEIRKYCDYETFNCLRITCKQYTQINPDPFISNVIAECFNLNHKGFKFNQNSVIHNSYGDFQYILDHHHHVIPATDIAILKKCLNLDMIPGWTP